MSDSVVDNKNVAAADVEEVCEISNEKKTVVEAVSEKVVAAGADEVAEVSEVVVTEPEDSEKTKNDAVVVEEVAEDGVNEPDSCKLKEKTTNGSLKNGLSKAAAVAAAGDDEQVKHDDENGDSQDDLIHEIKVTDVSGEDNGNDVCSLKRKSLTGDVPAEKKRKTTDENDHESVVVEVKNGSEKVA